MSTVEQDPGSQTSATQPADASQERRMSEKTLLRAVVIPLTAVAFLGPAALVLIAANFSDRIGLLDAYSLPILLIGGIVMFLLALCLVVIVFQRLGLASSNYALGLPEGSIRAFIALALILLFFMMAVYLFAAISKNEGEVLRGLTPAAADAIPDGRVDFQVPRGAVVDVHLNRPDSAADDVARQIITTMSTLVVAIASFYFGTSSVQQAFNAVPPGAAVPPSLAVIEPQNTPRVLRRKGDRGWESEKVRLKSTPADSRVEGSVEGDLPKSLNAVDDSGTYDYTPIEPAADGVTLKFSLGEHKGSAVSVTYRVPDGGEAGAAAGSPPSRNEASREQPLVEQPLVEQPLLEQPLVPEVPVEQPVVDQPVVEQPVVEQPGDPQPE